MQINAQESSASCFVRCYYLNQKQSLPGFTSANFLLWQWNLSQLKIKNNVAPFPSTSQGFLPTPLLRDGKDNNLPYP